MKKKINLKILTKKALIYRFIVIFVQIFYTYLFINNWDKAINISWSWNLINLFLFFGYSYLFDKKKSPYIETTGAVIWFTGLSGAGKTTTADIVAKKLKEKGKNVERLDGDIVRGEGLSDDLGFTKEDRDKNIRRVTFVAKLLSRNDTIVLASFISPYKAIRKRIRNKVNNFIEVFVNPGLNVCIERDIKGMYTKAIKGEIDNFTGISDPYEEPIKPDMVLDTEEETEKESANKVIEYLKKEKLI